MTLLRCFLRALADAGALKDARDETATLARDLYQSLFDRDRLRSELKDARAEVRSLRVFLACIQIEQLPEVKQ